MENPPSKFDSSLFNIQYPNVPRETFGNVNRLIKNHHSLLKTYLDQLLWWNERINLVSRNVSRGTIWHHIRHSLILTELESFKGDTQIVDAGTGGGLPGLPLAIAYPEKHFILNDIVTKKTVAIKQMARKLGVKNATIRDGSIAEYVSDNPFLLISKHAFKINELWKMVNDKPWSEMVFYKGLNFEDELTGIEVPLSIEVYDLGQYSGDEFYKEKALIVVRRQNS